MSTHKVGEAIQRVEAVLRRRPEAGLHDDAPAAASWQQGLRFAVSHPDGAQFVTDMPTELGGSGDQVTPGWLFRAGLAACSATSILMAAAAAGISLTALDVRAESRSDARGLLGLAGADGQPVEAGPRDVTLRVTIAADGVAAAVLRALVEAGVRRSPVPSALVHATPLDLQITVAG